MPSKYWSDFVQGLDPYVPGEQPKQQDLIKLNTNENPYPPSPKVVEVLNQDAVKLLRLYPDPSNLLLKTAIANYHNMDLANVCVGNGSDEILAFAFQAFFKQRLPILFPDITYGFYTVYCGLFDINYTQIPLADDFSIKLSDYQRENGGVIFANPNAPTGIGKSLQSIEVFLQSNTESVVIVDEAYVDFGAESAASLVGRYPNLLVVQTLSKSRSLAGSRVGFALGNTVLIEALEKVKNSFNPYSVDRLAEAAAVAAIDDVAYFEQCCAKIIKTRQWVSEQLESLGFEVLPSQANFVLVRPMGISAPELFAQLRQHSIVVRFFKKPRVDAYIRVTIGNDNEMIALVDALKEILLQRR